jgi:hypothetical protein
MFCFFSFWKWGGAELIKCNSLVAATREQQGKEAMLSCSASLAVQIVAKC